MVSSSLRFLAAFALLALPGGCTIEGSRQRGDTCLMSRECVSPLRCEVTSEGVTRCVEPVRLSLPDAAPTDVAPMDVAPTDTAPTDLAPTDTAPTDLAPTDLAPTDTAPPDLAPTDVPPEATSSDVPRDLPLDATLDAGSDARSDRSADTTEEIFDVVDTSDDPPQEAATD